MAGKNIVLAKDAYIKGKLRAAGESVQVDAETLAELEAFEAVEKPADKDADKADSE